MDSEQALIKQSIGVLEREIKAMKAKEDLVESLVGDIKVAVSEDGSKYESCVDSVTIDPIGNDLTLMFNTRCESKSNSTSTVCLEGVDLDKSNTDPNSEDVTEELKVLDEVLSSEFRIAPHDK